MIADQKEAYKIIFSGPVGSGKSTAINSISDIHTVSTEEEATDETRDIKQNTTVAMDYGILKLSGGGTVHLYGTPGQDRFSYMWDILTEGGLGLVLLIKSTNPSSLDELDFFLDAFSDFISRTAVAIGITNLDQAPHQNINLYQQHLMKKNIFCPVFDVDAREKTDVQILVQALLTTLVQQ
ncbi:MAG: GTP-binding protein [Gammaproteobacteria bacterium]|nr:GTP-binding protein [Gammaproteobacteria bacterium]